MFRSGGTTWLLVFIGLIFVAVITGADQESDPLYDYDDPDIPDECKDEDEGYDYSSYDYETAGSNNLSVIEPEDTKLSCGNGKKVYDCSDCTEMYGNGSCGGDCKWVEAHKKCLSEEDLNANCKDYHQTKEPNGPKCKKCHHVHFPSETIQERIGDANVKSCCSGHGYIFKDNCKWPNRTITHKKMACGYSDNSVKAFKSTFVCGLGCERWHHSHLNYDKEYKNQISNNLGREIFNSYLPEDLEVQKGDDSFCAAYECNEDVGWEIGFEVCVCPKQDANKERVDKNILKKYPLYCDFGVTLHDGKTLSCPQDRNKGPKICSTDAWKEVKLDEKLSNEVVDPKIQYLIGYSWPTYPGHWHTGLQLKRYECKKPCKGETPCIR